MIKWLHLVCLATLSTACVVYGPKPVARTPPAQVEVAVEGKAKTSDPLPSTASCVDSPVAVDTAPLPEGATVGAWRTLAHRMPTARSYVTTAVLGDSIYVIGGNDPAARLTSVVEVLNTATGTWSVAAPALTARNAARAAVLGGTIYLVGGHGTLEQGRLATVEAYDPKTDQWQQRAPMSTRRHEAAVAVVGCQLYVFGGATGSRYLNTAERFDPATNRWTPIADMPRERKGGAATVVAGRVFVFGGGRGDGGYPPEVDIYDPTTNSWSTGPSPMPTRRWMPTASTVGDKIFVVGGAWFDRGMKYSAAVDIYDPATGRWTKGEPLPEPRASHSAGVVGGDLYVIGGCNQGCNHRVDAVAVLRPFPRAEAPSTGSIAKGTPHTEPNRHDRPGQCPFQDRQTGLCWQNPPSSRSLKLAEAIAYCEQATDQGFTDWRLPTIGELKSLLRKERKPCRWDAALRGTCTWYQSSSKVDGAPYDGHFVDFNKASVDYGAFNIPKYVRCVRGQEKNIAR